MSDLKYQSLSELQASREQCEAYIASLKSSLSGQEQRLHWIKKYIYEKTPQELSISEIETLLGFKLILKR